MPTVTSTENVHSRAPCRWGKVSVQIRFVAAPEVLRVQYSSTSGETTVQTPSGTSITARARPDHRYTAPGNKSREGSERTPSRSRRGECCAGAWPQRWTKSASGTATKTAAKLAGDQVVGGPDHYLRNHALRAPGQRANHNLAPPATNSRGAANGKRAQPPTCGSIPCCPTAQRPLSTPSHHDREQSVHAWKREA